MADINKNTTYEMIRILQCSLMQKCTNILNLSFFLVSVEAPNVITFNVIICLDPLVQYCNSSLYKNLDIVILQLLLSFPVSPKVITLSSFHMWCRVHTIA